MGKWLIGALLATVGAGGIIAPAQAQDGRGEWRGRRGGEQQQQQRTEGQRGGWRNQAAQAQMQAEAQAQPQQQRGGWRSEAAQTEVQAQPQYRERRGGWNDDSRAQAQVGGDTSYQRRDWQRQQQAAPAQVAPQQYEANRRDWGNRDRNGNGRPDAWNDRDQRAQGAQTWRSVGRNDGRYDDRRTDNRGYDNRAWSGGQRYDNRGSWNRTWRQDNRYDWNRYRSGNRNAFRLPRYYAPYGWSYGYRRFSIGVALSSVLWGQDYWIDDPYSYRLPEAYGPYRWVRYYNDALLIDIRNGTVVDTVYDIFYY